MRQRRRTWQIRVERGRNRGEHVRKITCQGPVQGLRTDRGSGNACFYARPRRRTRWTEVVDGGVEDDPVLQLQLSYQGLLTLEHELKEEIKTSFPEPRSLTAMSTTIQDSVS